MFRRVLFRSDLANRFGRTKGNRIYAELAPNMDPDQRYGSSAGITGKEAEETLREMEKNSYDGIDNGDVDKLRGVLGKYFK